MGAQDARQLSSTTDEPARQQHCEEQASTGAQDHTSHQSEAVDQQDKAVSLRSTSPDHSGGSFDFSSVESISHNSTASRKTPFHRRIAKILGRSNGSSRVRLVKEIYGPRIRQNIRSLDGYPQGYGKIAAIEACDPNFLIYRKFNWLHNRLLLHYQDELAQLERRLEGLDKDQFREEPDRLISRRRDDVLPGAERKDLLTAIDTKLAQYDALLLRIQKKHSIKRPTKRNQSSLWHLITSTQSQASLETEWIHLGPDLAALAHDQEYGKFNTFLENAMNHVSAWLTKFIFRSREQKIISGSEEITLLSAARFDVLLRIVLTILAAALLLIPVLILFKNQPTSPSQIQEKGKVQILTIFSFTMAFSASCSIFTKAKRQEVFTATAAYCAVLVVFLGNTSNVIVPAAG